MSIQRYMDKLKLWHMAVILSIISAAVAIHPLFLAMPVSPLTQAFQAQIDKLKSGDAVLFGFEMNINDWNSARDVYRAILTVLIARAHVKIVFAGFSLDWPTVVTSMEAYIDFQALGGYVYGQDYVFLPYGAGEETAVAAVATNILGTFSTDLKGNALSSLPLVVDHPNLGTYQLIIARWSIFTFGDMYVRQWATPAYSRNIPMIVVGGYSTIAYAYGKYIVGCMNSAGEYEYLVGVPGEDIIKADAGNVGVFLGIGLVALANIAMLQGRSAKERDKASATKSAQGGKSL